MIVLENLTFALDTPEALPAGAGTFVVKGWCVLKNASDVVELFVRVKETKFPAILGLPRPDVAEYFENGSLSKSGFLVRFRCPPNLESASLMCRLNRSEATMIQNIIIPTANSMSSDTESANWYNRWIVENESNLFWPEDEIADRLAHLEHRPLISIILPTFNTPKRFLDRCIESVLEQHYPRWQLCIADDHSSDGEVFERCSILAASDQRIRLDRCEMQSGISNASNLALTHAEGEFVVPLDHDDELHPYALLELVRALNRHRECRLFYSDEDKIDIWGIRDQPAFKPDFDREIFLSFNYLGHFIAISRAVIGEVGGFRPFCDGAQDWDLLIRVTEVIAPSEIQHIRKPLYHWRMHEQSTSTNLDAKPYVAAAWSRVLADHVHRTAKNVSVTEGLFYGSMRIRYRAPANLKVAVFLRAEDGMYQANVVMRNAGRTPISIYDLIECAVFKRSEPGKAALGASANGSVGPSGSICSLTEVKEEVLVFINGSLESINHLFFDELIAQAMRDDCGVVTGISVDNENRVLATGLVRASNDELLDPHIGLTFPDNGYMGQMAVVRSIDVCPDTFFAVRREHLAAVGGLGGVSSSRMQQVAEKLSKHSCNNGLSVLFTPYAVATFNTQGSKRAGLVQAFSRQRKLNPLLLSRRVVNANSSATLQ